MVFFIVPQNKVIDRGKLRVYQRGHQRGGCREMGKLSYRPQMLSSDILTRGLV